MHIYVTPLYVLSDPSLRSDPSFRLSLLLPLGVTRIDQKTRGVVLQARQPVERVFGDLEDHDWG